MSKSHGISPVYPRVCAMETNDIEYHTKGNLESGKVEPKHPPCVSFPYKVALTRTTAHSDVRYLPNVFIHVPLFRENGDP